MDLLLSQIMNHFGRFFLAGSFPFDEEFIADFVPLTTFCILRGSVDASGVLITAASKMQA